MGSLYSPNSNRNPCGVWGPFDWNPRGSVPLHRDRPGSGLSQVGRRINTRDGLSPGRGAKKGCHNPNRHLSDNEPNRYSSRLGAGWPRPPHHRDICIDFGGNLCLHLNCGSYSGGIQHLQIQVGKICFFRRSHLLCLLTLVFRVTDWRMIAYL